MQLPECRKKRKETSGSVAGEDEKQKRLSICLFGNFSVK